MRSLMFVPGHRQNMLDKAVTLPLDVALLDLEDGVPPAEKATARELVARILGRPASGPTRYVRINPLWTEWAEADLEAIARPGLAGVVLPKVSDADEVRQLAARLPPDVRIMPSVESARGLLDAPAIARASPRVSGVLFGAEDFANDLGLPAAREAEASELLYARSAIVVACAAANVASIDGIWPDIRDADGLRRDALRARRLGFTGKSCVHPDQIAAINEAFSPSPEDVEDARSVVAAFEEAQARGEGAIALGGQLVDPPIVERARRAIRVHEVIAARG